MKRIVSAFTSFVLFAATFVSCGTIYESSEQANAVGKVRYTAEDLYNLQDFILAKETPDLNGKDYDLNNDNRWDVFDLCLMRQYFAEQPSDNVDSLVVYFSRTNNTEKIAEYLIESGNMDCYEIEAAVPYTDEDISYNNSSCRANKEQGDKTVRPEIADPIDSISDYEVIYLGYPIWWGEEPRIIDTFLESYDFSDKIVIPFCTSASSGISNSERNIANLVAIGTQLAGKRFASNATKESVVEWLNEKQSEISEITKNSQYEFIKGSTFSMGSPESEPERSTDEIQHQVTVGDFYMSKNEISQKEYQELMGNNPSENVGDNLPVTNITWYDAVQYCNKLSIKEGFTPCYTISGTTVTWNKNADGYRLPTEAEWEYAARANTDTPFSFGDYVNDDDANCYNAYGYNNDASGKWINGYLQHTVDVDSYNANGFGLYNMHGNVAEWVWDWYGEYSNQITDPTGAEQGSYKIARGGGWNDMPKHIRSAYRSAFPADVPFYSIGIRPVRSAEFTNETVTSQCRTVSDSSKNGKVLIAYFSQTGNTDGFAKMIAEKTNADIFRIERAVPYSATSNSTKLYGEALDEIRANSTPELKTYLEDAGLNIDDYDTILLGYCNWWASIPAPVATFLSHYDLSGKTIIPFCSMGGGRFGQTISMTAKLTPDSIIKKGLDVTYSSYDEEEIDQWLKENDVKAEGEYTMNITVGNTTLTAEMCDNSSAKALKEMLESGSLTINMSDYADFEKVGSLGTSLPRNDEQITTEAGDLILYQGNSFVIYYDTNSWNFTRLGKINNATKESLLKVLGDGDVTVTLSLADNK